MIRLEEQPKPKTFLRNAPIPPEEILKKLPELSKDDFEIVEDSSRPERTYTISKTQKRWTFVLSFNGRMGRAEVGARDPRGADNSRPSMGFSMRSVDGMVFYLGELVRLQREGAAPPLVMVGSEKKKSVLFRVDFDGSLDLGDRIEVNYLGQRVGIPRQNSDQDRTLTVLSLLSQLFSLYRESTDLPRTTAVQVVGAP